MIHNINSLKDIFEDYFDNILIILSQCDFKNVENILEIHKIIEKKTQFNKIICSFKNMDETMICNLYEKILNYKNKMRMIPRIIIKSINLIDHMETSNYNLFDKEIINFKTTLSLFEDKLKEYENNELMQKALFFALKEYKIEHLKFLIRPLLKEINNFSDIDKLILELISYSKKIKQIIIQFISSFKVGLQLGIRNDCDRGIKKCPCCGTIWTKYSGSGYIFCGKRGNCPSLPSHETKNYMIKFFDNKFIIKEEIYNYTNYHYSSRDSCYYSNEKMDVIKTKITKMGYPTNPWLLRPEDIKKNEISEKLNKALIQPVGCLNHIIWYYEEDITKEIIKKLDDNLSKDYTEFYSDVLDFEQKLKNISSIKDIKDGKLDLFFKEKIIVVNSSK